MGLTAATPTSPSKYAPIQRQGHLHLGVSKNLPPEQIAAKLPMPAESDAAALGARNYMLFASARHKSRLSAPVALSRTPP